MGGIESLPALAGGLFCAVIKAKRKSEAALLCRGSDPAARAAVTAFVHDPPDVQATLYNVAVGQVWAVRQYLEGLVRAFVAPVFQSKVLGPLAGPNAGGMVVARTVGQWMDGEFSMYLATQKEYRMPASCSLLC